MCRAQTQPFTRNRRTCIAIGGGCCAHTPTSSMARLATNTTRAYSADKNATHTGGEARPEWRRCCMRGPILAPPPQHVPEMPYHLLSVRKGGARSESVSTAASKAQTRRGSRDLSVRDADAHLNPPPRTAASAMATPPSTVWGVAREGSHDVAHHECNGMPSNRELPRRLPTKSRPEGPVRSDAMLATITGRAARHTSVVAP